MGCESIQICMRWKEGDVHNGDSNNDIVITLIPNCISSHLCDIVIIAYDVEIVSNTLDKVEWHLAMAMANGNSLFITFIEFFLLWFFANTQTILAIYTFSEGSFLTIYTLDTCDCEFRSCMCVVVMMTNSAYNNICSVCVSFSTKKYRSLTSSSVFMRPCTSERCSLNFLRMILLIASILRRKKAHNSSGAVTIFQLLHLDCNQKWFSNQNQFTAQSFFFIYFTRLDFIANKLLSIPRKKHQHFIHLNLNY